MRKSTAIERSFIKDKETTEENAGDKVCIGPQIPYTIIFRQYWYMSDIVLPFALWIMIYIEYVLRINEITRIITSLIHG